MYIILYIYINIYTYFYHIIYIVDNMIMMDIASSWGHFISQPGNPNVALSRIVESSEYVDVLIHVIVSLWLCRPRLRLDSRLAAL